MEKPFVRQLKDICKGNYTKGLLYVDSKKKAIQLYRSLTGNGFQVAEYHSEAEEKEQNFQNWGPKTWLIVTDKFMGYQKDDCNVIVHVQPPKTMM